MGKAGQGSALCQRSDCTSRRPLTQIQPKCPTQIDSEAHGSGHPLHCGLADLSTPNISPYKVQQQLSLPPVWPLAQLQASHLRHASGPFAEALRDVSGCRDRHLWRRPLNLMSDLLHRGQPNLRQGGGFAAARGLRGSPWTCLQRG